MKLSLNWAQYYSNVDLLAIGKDKLIERIGAQLGAVEGVEELGERYKDIYVVKVVSCQPHPNADKLKVCKIDDGKKAKHVKRDDKGLVKVVCGAPNVHEGMLAGWIPPGGTVPSTLGNDDELVLAAREIRGVVSNGMLASAHELAISDDHRGIAEFGPDEAKVGDMLIKALQLDDTVVDIENKMFTHRPDLFGQLGIARELAGIQGLAFKSHESYLKHKAVTRKAGLPLEIKNEIPKLVPRFGAEVYENVTIKPSPLWMQSYLSRVGIRPINNIVDITNYMMMLTAQPMHAYDYDKVKGSSAKATIVVRHPKKGEKVNLLGGKQLETRTEDIAIASDKQLIGLGGVMGGADTEVDESTKNVILECANFDMYTIRRTAMEHGLFTEAVTRFTKGQSALQIDRVMDWARGDLVRETGGLPTTLVDKHAGLTEPKPVKVTAEFINARLGEKLKVGDMAKLLTNVEFEVKVSGQQLTVTPPFWRTDIEIPEDIVEEVGRLYGYDHLPLELPKRTITPSKTDGLLATKSQIRDILAGAGANEILSYTFVHGSLMEKVAQDPKHAFELSNALSPDLQYYRLSLLPSLLEKIHPNIKQGHEEFALFEINPVHAKDFVSKDKLPIEDQRLAFVFAAGDKVAKQKYGGAPYYQARNYLIDLLTELGISEPVFEPAADYQPKMAISQAAIAPFEKKRGAIVKTKDREFIGEIGEFRAAVRKKLKLPEFVAGFELDVKQLMKLAGGAGNYEPIPRFPKVEQDISLKVPAKLGYGELFGYVWGELHTSEGNMSISLSPVDIFQRKNDKDHKQVTLRLSIASYERTLKGKEVNLLLDKVAAAAKTKFGSERI